MNICYWFERDNGYWEAGCQKSEPKRLMSFSQGVGPAEAYQGMCPACLKDLFEVRKTTDKEEFINELNLRDFHR